MPDDGIARLDDVPSRNMTSGRRRAMTAAFMPDGVRYNGRRDVRALSESYLDTLAAGDLLNNDALNPRRLRSRGIRTTPRQCRSYGTPLTSASRVSSRRRVVSRCSTSAATRLAAITLKPAFGSPSTSTKKSELALGVCDPARTQRGGAMQGADQAAEHARDCVGIPAETGSLDQGQIRIAVASEQEGDDSRHHLATGRRHRTLRVPALTSWGWERAVQQVGVEARSYVVHTGAITRQGGTRVD
jgi:hypothetical protein